MLRMSSYCRSSQSNCWIWRYQVYNKPFIHRKNLLPVLLFNFRFMSGLNILFSCWDGKQLLENLVPCASGKCHTGKQGSTDWPDLTKISILGEEFDKWDGPRTSPSVDSLKRVTGKMVAKRRNSLHIDKGLSRWFIESTTRKIWLQRTWWCL